MIILERDLGSKSHLKDRWSRCSLHISSLAHIALYFLVCSKREGIASNVNKLFTEQCIYIFSQLIWSCTLFFNWTWTNDKGKCITTRNLNRISSIHLFVINLIALLYWSHFWSLTIYPYVQWLLRYFENKERPVIFYKYNKPIRPTMFNFNKFISDLVINFITQLH